MKSVNYQGIIGSALTLASELAGDAYFHEDNGIFYLPLRDRVAKVTQAGAVSYFVPTNYSAPAVSAGNASIYRKSATRLIIVNRVDGATLYCIEINTATDATVASQAIAPVGGGTQAFSARAFCYLPGTNELIAPFYTGGSLESYGRYQADNSGHVLDSAGQNVITSFQPGTTNIFYLTYNGAISCGVGIFPIAGFPAGPVGGAQAMGVGTGPWNSSGSINQLCCDGGVLGFAVGINGVNDKLVRIEDDGSSSIIAIGGDNKNFTCIASYDDGNLALVDAAGFVRVVTRAGVTVREFAALSAPASAGTVAVKKNSVTTLAGTIGTDTIALYRA